jgi:predicted naringenin-chalcone synthase
VKVIDAPQLSAPVAPRRGSPSPLKDGAATALAARRVGTRISRLAVADAETSFSQDEVLALLGMTGDEFAERIFARCGVRRRHLNLTGDFLATTLQGRTPQIEEELFNFAIQAVDRLQVDPLQIGTVVTATLYSLGGPTLAHRIVDHFHMDPATDKYHLVGIGCASAVPLMRLVAQSLHHHPQKLGLIVAAESMAGILMRSAAEDPRAKIVGSAIFVDGCAAALLTDDPHAEGPVIVSSKVHQIGDTLGAVSMELATEDSYLHLDRDLPDVAAAGLRDLVEDFLERNDLSHSAIDHWMVHPGGQRIIDCTQSALSLSEEDVAISRDVLANHGNIGTPSIFYVLEQVIDQREPHPSDRGLVVTIGPGITVGLMLLEW